LLLLLCLRGPLSIDATSGLCPRLLLDAMSGLCPRLLLDATSGLCPRLRLLLRLLLRLIPICAHGVVALPAKRRDGRIDVVLCASIDEARQPVGEMALVTRG
jgi:hypothetical protein